MENSMETKSTLLSTHFQFPIYIGLMGGVIYHLLIMRVLQVVLFAFILVYHCIRRSSSGSLVLGYYKETCPAVEDIVLRIVRIAVLKDPRMAASLLRLHFHDCFVMGCDASLLLDNFGSTLSEKQAGPNVNSLRGFDVIDEIKYILEETCPGVVSCADILAIAARDAVVLRGGPTWNVHLGRRDSLTASFNGANQFIPAPNSTLENLIANFQQQGLDSGDLVALSGSHTMGKARCVSFRQRIYDNRAPNRFGYHDDTDRIYVRSLRSMCPISGRDNAVAPLDLETPARFDNYYFQNIIQGRGLLISDNVLDEDPDSEMREHVFAYASDQEYFFDSFVKSIIKMGNINVLTQNQGEIRRNCRYINT